MNKLLLVDGRYGIYVPQEFARRYYDICTANERDMKIILRGPDKEGYWEAWDNILLHGSVVINGARYGLEQDEDLFAVQW